MSNNLLHIGLTLSQVSNLIEFIEMNFIESIRLDDDVDNIDYVVDMMDALQRLRRVKADNKSVCQNDNRINCAVKEVYNDNKTES